uniref:Zinc finger protein 225-like n=1 Tax=Diabrotica virgifera virgifera TaxID=50390 RepID=A0A6P7FYD0_DIAVI
MEVKQEVMEETCKIEVDHNELNDVLLDTFKSEIKEEPQSETTHHSFDYLNSEEYPLKTDVKQDEDKLCPLEVKQSFICEDTPTDECNELKDHISKQMTQCTTAIKKVKAVERRSQEKQLECEISPKQFSTSSYLKVHMKMHSGENLFECEICTKKFLRSSTLKEHMRVHTGEKRFACDICTKQFLRRFTLKEHMRVHTGEKRFACDICTKQFLRRFTLKEHMRVHTGEKRFACDICTKQFSHKPHLKVHMMTHTGEKPFGC